MTIKEQIAQEIEKLPESLLQEILDFVQFIQAKHSETVISNNNQPTRWLLFETLRERPPLGTSLIVEHTLTGSTAQDLLEFVGCWEGSDIRECLELVHETRMPLEF